MYYPAHEYSRASRSPEPLCLRVVLEEGMKRQEVNPINEAVIKWELNTALGFELHTEETDVARFDCRKVGCMATCGVISTDQIPRLNPPMQRNSQWLDGCIEPQS